MSVISIARELGVPHTATVWSAVEGYLMSELSGESFIVTLWTDLAGALERHRKSDDQSARRDLVRTTFAAVEGLAWVYREHVLELARLVSELAPDEEGALADTTHQPTSEGLINSQPRFVPLMPTIRLIERIAHRITPEASIDFSANEWSLLRKSIKVRNRITHPKALGDLQLGDEDISFGVEALFWLAEQTVSSMAAINVVSRRYADGLNDMLDQLKQSDPKTLLEYEAAARALDKSTN